MKRFIGIALLLVLPACVLHAQDHPLPADYAVGTARALWQVQSGYVTQAAEDMPEAKYSYKPTPDVRSFGQLVAHVAGSQYMICAAAIGDSARAEDDIEKSKTSKADLVAAMRASNEYCARAYRQTDNASAHTVKLFGQERTRLNVLMLNATHDAEHYGNIVTYLRLNGMVPPSSKRQ
jgi:uncharacterized damage-inducible protein DinB